VLLTSSAIVLTGIERVLNIILAVCSMALPMGYIIYMNRQMDAKIQDAKDWFMELYVNEKADLIQNLPKIGEKLAEPMLKSLNFSKLGQASGMSRQMKALEKDVITDAVDARYPGMGSMAAKYIQKYPWLAGFLGNLQKGNGEGAQHFSRQRGM